MLMHGFSHTEARFCFAICYHDAAEPAQHGRPRHTRKSLKLWHADPAGLAAACGSVDTAGTTAAQACQGLQVNSTGGLTCPQECATAFQQVRACLPTDRSCFARVHAFKSRMHAFKCMHST